MACNRKSINSIEGEARLVAFFPCGRHPTPDGKDFTWRQPSAVPRLSRLQNFSLEIATRSTRAQFPGGLSEKIIKQSSLRGVHSWARWLSCDPSECSELMVDSGRKRRQETGNYLPEGRY
ncbi:hypothetical protein K0M31_017965 [Melipona bicolor]|uniref:Uncharacterized protein n=1 Tax=Melipona bicolor TaxID=60889 RepID=A0AA40KE00_9HYME|nr:hypothetical protein K0M31_017965 [Melipona bicolor]